ncbi:PLP-dependent aminotransferase family protein [Kitasatospora sp. NBC_01287]|uniref:MocR-like pyridoxine biosynthesis transcription factor PdxR n=1 Tax=Kitasatospora sp. NBC_01287 TaxID=2903573 RepID=UPI0022574140|nr:PLP-dependent aminotransferase family protein [Kitasatospora sp. NBC_01287]MCX4745323.1 PLP-dependent aminotransferase family protein [Kitasatospora sp. NBC_01287]
MPVPVPVLVPGLDLLIELGPPGVRGTRRRAVEEALRTAIREGRLPPGARLPATRDLAEQLGLSRGTVSQAYEQLIAEGWLIARTKAGTRVADGVATATANATANATATATAAANAAATDPRLPARPLPSLSPSQTSASPTPPWSGPPSGARHDLSPGRPDVSAFPRAAWARALRRAIHEAPAEAFGYGDPRGRIELRTALAGYLGRVRGVRVAPDHLLICAGFTQALGLLTAVFAGTGVGAIAIENPAMPEHLAIAAARLGVRDVTVDDQGLRVAELAATDAGAVLCTPAHQFPLGVSLSPARRAALLAWADERDGWIVEDDYDGEFRYDRRPVGALQARRPDRVVYAGSISKSLGPAVRLGWIACPPRLLEPLVAAKHLADRQSPVLEQLALADLLDSGAYDHHLRTMRRGYRRRRDLLVRSVAELLPRARITGIAAGLHAILELPSAPSSTVLSSTVPDSTVLCSIVPNSTILSSTITDSTIPKSTIPKSTIPKSIVPSSTVPSQAIPGPTEQRIAEALRQASVRARLLGGYLRGPVAAEAPPALVVGYATPSAHAYAGALDALLSALRALG